MDINLPGNQRRRVRPPKLKQLIPRTSGHHGSTVYEDTENIFSALAAGAKRLPPQAHEKAPKLLESHSRSFIAAARP